MRRITILALSASFLLFVWGSPPAFGEAITSATVGGYLFASFDTPGLPSFNVSTKRPKRISLDVARSDEHGQQGQFVGVLNMTGGKRPTIDLACSATGKALHQSDSYAFVEYAFRVVQKDPEAPLLPVWVSIDARFEASVFPAAGSPIPWVTASAVFRPSRTASAEWLTGGTCSAGSPTIHGGYSDSKIVAVGSTGYLSISARGYTDTSTKSRGEWQVVVDPIIGIDRTRTVLVNGVEVPAWQLYDIEMSDGFLPSYGEPFTWVNPAGGAFEEAANWDTWDGPAVPQEDADLEFMSLPEGRVFPVTLDQSCTIAGLSVCDTDVTLQLEGHRLENTGPIVIGQLGPDRGMLEIENGTLTADGGIKMGMTPDVAGVLQIDTGATLETTRIQLNSNSDSMLGSGTLVLAGGTLRAEQVIVSGPRSVLTFDAGTMILDGSSSSFSTGSPIVVGNGTDAANLTVLSGVSWFANGLTLASGATLELHGGLLRTASFDAAPGSTITWSGGKWLYESLLTVGDGEPLGANLSINAGTNLAAPGGLHVGTSGHLLINGGTLSAATFTHDAGASLEYAGGDVQLDGGDIVIGPGELTGPGGSETVTLAAADDQLATWTGGLSVKENCVLHVATGAVQAAGLVVEGIFDYGGLAPDEPGHGVLCFYFNDQEPGGLRIGTGSGDAVINGRTIVRIAPDGCILVNGGSLRVDPGYQLHLQGLARPDTPNNVSASRIDLAGTIVLEQGGLSANELIIEPTGSLVGDGIVRGNVENGGLLSPGSSPGQIEIWGDYVQTSEGKLVLEIESPTEFDALRIHGCAYLAGTLEIVLCDGYAPGPGDSFELISAGYLDGRFDEVIVTGGVLGVEYSPHGLVVTVVPEPSMLLLLGGMIALVLATRRRTWS